MLVPIAVGLVALPLLFRNVGPQVFTLFLLSFGAINFAPSLDLGVARTLQRRIAYAATLHSETLNALVAHSLRRGAMVAIGMAVLATIGAVFLFPTEHSLVSKIGLPLITGLGVSLVIYANCQRGVLEGLGAFSRSALNRAGVGIMLVGAPVTVSFFVRDATALSLAALLVRLPFIWEQQRAIRSALSTRYADDTAAREDVISGFMRESGWFAVLSVLAVAMCGFDRYIMIGWGGLSGQALATFLATQDLALRAIAVPAALLPALTVRLAASNGTVAARPLARRLFLIIVPGVILGCAGGALLSPYIVHLLYPLLPAGAASDTLRILFLGIAANAVAQFPMARLVAAGRARDNAIMHLCQFVLYLAVVPFAIQRFGPMGAAGLWSGRIIFDAAMLIAWSGYAQKDRSSTLREAIALILGMVAIVGIGSLA
jgi:O-antigen/teichoic acid export membrane protein